MIRVSDGRASRKSGVSVCAVYLLSLRRRLTGPTTPHLPLNQDYFLEYYPFAVAEATCLAFGEHFRGSAAQFTDTFHNSLYVEARRVFCGVETTPEAMGHKREQMALIPENEKVGVLSARPSGDATHSVE